MKKRLLLAVVVLTGMFLLTASIVWAAAPAPVAKTGQTTSYRTGDDGDLQKGVDTAWWPRFKDNSDGTVTDNLTGLMWAKDASLGGTKNWVDALAYANNLSLGNEGCGSNYTDWRLPNINELKSLVAASNNYPPLPSGHPFTNVQSSNYWSSTSYAYWNFYLPSTWGSTACIVDMGEGDVNVFSMKDISGYSYIWPVRSDN